jgi:hypothetical protein
MTARATGLPALDFGDAPRALGRGPTGAASRMKGRNHDRSSILRLEGRWQFLQTPGTWFWALVSLGIVLRAYFVLFTQGTYDVDIWWGHAQGVVDKGLVGQSPAARLLGGGPAGPQQRLDWSPVPDPHAGSAGAR